MIRRIKNTNEQPSAFCESGGVNIWVLLVGAPCLPNRQVFER